MTDKPRTWMKIHTGILDADHRERMGVCVWLFMWLVDRADWETGTVFNFTDQEAAESLEMPKSTLTKWRNRLQNEGYITCEQGFQCQNIVIHRWRNPRQVNPEQINVPDPEPEEADPPYSQKINGTQIWVAMPPAKWVPFHIDQILITLGAAGKLSLPTQEVSATPTKPPYWGDLVVETRDAFKVPAGVAAVMAEQLIGMARRGERSKFNCEPPAQLGDVAAFVKWYHGENPTANLPEGAETLQKWWHRFKHAPAPRPREYADGLTQAEVDVAVARALDAAAVQDNAALEYIALLEAA